MSLVTTSANAGCGKGTFGRLRLGIVLTFILLLQDIFFEKGYGCEVESTKGSTTPIMAALFDQTNRYCY